MNTKFKVLKTMLLSFIAIIILAFTTKEALVVEDVDRESGMTEVQFHENVHNIISGKEISQNDLAQMIMEAEHRKSKDESPSEYIEAYMNTNFKTETTGLERSSSNRVSIASPGQSDLNMSVSCDQTAFQDTSGSPGYYYVFAESCNGEYDYDSGYSSSGAYAYAEAISTYRHVFIVGLD
ncbi:MAG: hypothetical protein ABJN84_15285 [Flavobacteriaceae bacterium]